MNLRGSENGVARVRGLETLSNQEPGQASGAHWVEDSSSGREPRSHEHIGRAQMSKLSVLTTREDDSLQGRG